MLGSEVQGIGIKRLGGNLLEHNAIVGKQSSPFRILCVKEVLIVQTDRSSNWMAHLEEFRHVLRRQLHQLLRHFIRLIEKARHGLHVLLLLRTTLSELHRLGTRNEDLHERKGLRELGF